METLTGRRPDVPASELIAALVPPPHFAEVSFDNYRPDDAHPSQADALSEVRSFGREATTLRRPKTGRGVYLDGGYGVGKTHLLAALAHAVGAKAAYGTFVEVTALIGALGYANARDQLASFRLLCVDEFELDDVGDTLMMARLMRELRDAGVMLAATSNTPPGALGRGRFAAEDFQREIHSLAEAFSVVRIEGEDYRHRGVAEFVPPSTTEAVRAATDHAGATCDDWSELVADIAHVHPSRYGAYVDGVHLVGLTDVAELTDQSNALRVVALVDRLYDRDVEVVASGLSLGQIFGADMLEGGYRKKYLRALSRLAAMTAAGAVRID